MTLEEVSELQLIAGALQGLYEKLSDPALLDLQLRIEKLLK